MPLNRDGAVGCQDLGTVGDFYLAFYLVGDYILYIYYICDIIEIIYRYLIFISIWDVMIRTDHRIHGIFQGCNWHGQALQLRDHIVASCPGAQGAQGAQGSVHGNRWRQGKTCKLMGKSQENMGTPRSGGLESWENHRTKWWHFPASGVIFLGSLAPRKTLRGQAWSCGWWNRHGGAGEDGLRRLGQWQTAPAPGGSDKSRQGKFGGAESPMMRKGPWNSFLDVCRISKFVVGGVRKEFSSFQVLGVAQTRGLLHMGLSESKMFLNYHESNRLSWYIMIIMVYHNFPR
jgi:hypothetical protein